MLKFVKTIGPVVLIFIAVFLCIFGKDIYHEIFKKSPAAEVKERTEQFRELFDNRVDDLRKNFRKEQFSLSLLTDTLTKISSLYFGKPLSADDSMQYDSLICLSGSYEAQRKYAKLLKKITNMASYDEVSKAKKLLDSLYSQLKPQGCLFGGLEPRREQLDSINNAIAFYGLKEHLHAARKNCKKGLVNNHVEAILVSADTIPDLFSRLQTSREELCQIKKQGQISSMVDFIETVYLKSSLNEIDGTVDIDSANDTRKALGLSWCEVYDMVTRATPDITRAWLWLAIKSAKIEISESDSLCLKQAS